MVCNVGSNGLERFIVGSVHGSKTRCKKSSCTRPHQEPLSWGNEKTIGTRCVGNYASILSCEARGREGITEGGCHEMH